MTYFTLNDSPSYGSAVSWSDTEATIYNTVVDIAAPVAAGFGLAYIADIPPSRGVAFAFLALLGLGVLGYNYRASKWLPQSETRYPTPPRYRADDTRPVDF